MPLQLEAPRLAHPAPRRRARLGALPWVMLLAVLLGMHPPTASIPAGSNNLMTFEYDLDHRLVAIKRNQYLNFSNGSWTQENILDHYAYDDRGRRTYTHESWHGSSFGLANSSSDLQRVEVYSGGTVARDYTFSNSSAAALVSAALWTPANTTLSPAEYIRGSDYGGGVGGILYSLHTSGNAITASDYHYDGRGDVVAQTKDDNTGTLTYQAAYTAWGGHSPTPALNHGEVLAVPMPAQMKLSNGTWTTFPYGGNIDTLRNEGAQEWTASGAVTDRYRKNTKEEDGTGLILEGQRYFNPELNIFMTPDPLGPVDGPNHYILTRDNPTYYDPLGLKWDSATMDADTGELRHYDQLDRAHQKSVGDADAYNAAADQYNASLARLKKTPFGSAEFNYLKNQKATYYVNVNGTQKEDEAANYNDSNKTFTFNTNQATLGNEAHEFMHGVQGDGKVEKQSGIFGFVYSSHDDEGSAKDREVPNSKWGEPKWMEAQAMRAQNIVEAEDKVINQKNAYLGGPDGDGSPIPNRWYKPQIEDRKTPFGTPILGLRNAGTNAYGSPGQDSYFKFQDNTGSYPFTEILQLGDGRTLPDAK